jgi:hypothetical protein
MVYTSLISSTGKSYDVMNVDNAVDRSDGGGDGNGGKCVGQFDAISEAVRRKLSELLQHWKPPNGSNEYSVVAAVVCEEEKSEGHPNSIEVVSVATGTKCIGRSQYEGDQGGYLLRYDKLIRHRSLVDM